MTFLGLGGSRRRGPGLVSSPPLQQQQQEFVLQPQQHQHEGDPLQALMAGKYAPGRAEAVESSLRLLRTKSWEDPVFGAGRSPRSTLNLSWETSRASGDSSGVSVHAGEEASSRFQGARQQSQALALAKKLRDSLGSKFADSLRETIKEVAKREKGEGESATEAWPQQLLEDISGGVSRSEGAVNACWPVEKDGNVVAQDRPSLLSFSSGSTVTRAESSLKGSFGGIARVTAKVSSWLPQASWEVRSQAQAVPSLSSSMDSPFFPSGAHSSLLGEGDTSMARVSGAKGQWMDGFTSSTQPAAVARRHFVPEAAAMGTSRSDSLLQQISIPSLQETFGRDKDQSLVDVFKGYQSSGKDCGSFLEFLNPGNPSNQALLDDARHRLYGRPAAAAADLCQDSVGEISGSDWRGNGAPLEFPESGAVGFHGVLKRTRDGFSSGSHVKSSKRQCMASDSALLDIPSSAIDADCEVKSDSELKDYFANLTASRESSYELPASSLAELMEDLSQDLLIPHVSS